MMNLPERDQSDLTPKEMKTKREVLGRSWIMIGLMFIFAGIFVIFVSVYLSALPLNVFSSITILFDRVLGLRFGTSIALFGMGGLNIFAGYSYMISKRKKYNILVALLNHPLVALAFFIISFLLLIQTFDPSGSISEIFAPLHGLDVDIKEDELHYAYILKQLPSMEIFVFSLACLIIVPFSTLIFNIVLSEYDFKLFKKKTIKRIKPTLQKRLMNRTSVHLFTGGLLIIILALLSYAIGYIMSGGIDITVALLNFNTFKFPTFSMDLGPLMMNVFPYILLGIAFLAMITSLLYKKAPEKKISRILAWILGITFLITPFYGLFLGIFTIMTLYNTRKHVVLEGKTVGK